MPLRSNLRGEALIETIPVRAGQSNSAKKCSTKYKLFREEDISVQRFKYPQNIWKKLFR
jgi:hypothetical protein